MKLHVEVSICRRLQSLCKHFSALIIFLLFIMSCSNGGEDNRLSPSPGANSQLERQAIERLVELYRTAVELEDIDRLVELLRPDNPSSPFDDQADTTQTKGRTLETSQTFREAMTVHFRELTITALDVPANRTEIASDRLQVGFLEMESAQDRTRLEHQTLVFRTTFSLQRGVENEVIAFRIAAARRDGPILRVATQQQLIAGAPVRLEVTDPNEVFGIAGVTTEQRGEVDFRRFGAVWQGMVTLPTQDSQPLRLRVRDQQGQTLEITHRYRLRRSDQWAVQQLGGTGATRFLALAIDGEGRAWAGGDRGSRLYVADSTAPDATFVGNLTRRFEGRIEGLTFDASRDRPPRLHAVVIDPVSQLFGVIVIDPSSNPLGICQTVNVFDANYPFFVTDLETEERTRSASARAIAASAGGIWLFGSDGGVARVTSDLADDISECMTPSVMYPDLIQRQNSELLSNSVPGLLEASDGALWLGTILGLMRRAPGQRQLTPLRFDPALALPENVETLEAFFRELAQAIFESRPLTTARTGDVSFDQAIVKADLITSLVEDTQGRIWAGSLGGGLRRIDFRNDRLQETWYLTRQGVARVDPETQAREPIPSVGLISDIIFALAIAPDQTVWVATDEGLSRVRETASGFDVVNISALDGLGAPVRDVEVSADGAVWLATDRGLFRLREEDDKRLEGVVRAPNGEPVAGVEVRLLGTPFRALTDADGRYVFVDVPPGDYQLQLDGSRAEDGRFGQAVQPVSVDDHQIEDVMIAPVNTTYQLMRISSDAEVVVWGTQSRWKWLR